MNSADAASTAESVEQQKDADSAAVLRYHSGITLYWLASSTKHQQCDMAQAASPAMGKQAPFSRT